MKITLVPQAGLCNRLNAIASGLAYQQKHPGTELTILWPKSRECRCQFSDLFQQLPDPWPKVREMPRSLKYAPGNKYNLFFPHWFRFLWFDVCFSRNDSPERFEEITRGKKNVYVLHFNRFCEDSIEQGLARFFRPATDIEERIDAVTSDWDGHVVGLHIRRTDNMDAIKKSPMQHFYDVIEAEMAKDAVTRFYLATDDEGVKDDLRARYGERILTLPALSLNRDTVEGMKDAVVDLYCLGKTCRIYGSQHSSYSEFAARLYDIDLVL